MALFLLACPHVQASPTDKARLQEAIEVLRAHLYAIRDTVSGSWELEAEWRKEEELWLGKGHEFGGRTALATYALLVSGESAQYEPVAQAIEFLKRCRMTGTYAVAIRAHVWAHVTNTGEALAHDAAWLLRSGEGSLFHYEPVSRGQGQFDHSCTQYGHLGLWEASKRGVHVPKQFWEDGTSHFVAVQTGDGSWGYRGEGTGISGSMTCAGLTCLLVARSQDRDGRLSPSGIDALNRGLSWLHKHYDGARNPPHGQWPYYYLYGIERVSLACGIRYLNGRDWFRDGFEYINGQLASNAASLLAPPNSQNASFALLFLSRGQYPCWISRLQLPGEERVAPPVGVARLTRYISDNFERELNWQAVSLETSPRTWLNTPLMLLAVTGRLELTETHVAALRLYVKLGGLLLAIPDSRTTRAESRTLQLARELFPEGAVSRLRPQHPLFSIALHPKPSGAKLTSVSNGARILMLLASDDWSRNYREDKPGRQGPPWQMGANLYAYATDMRRFGGRFDNSWEEPQDRTALLAIPVIRARYDGAWLTEPALWQAMAAGIHAQVQASLDVTDLDLDALGHPSAQGRFVHLSGVDAITLTDPQLSAIERHARGGGTLLVETVGGRGSFARMVERQIADRLGTAAIQIDRTSSVLTGAGMAGAYDVTVVGYRRRAVELLGVTRRPRLAAFYVKDRAAIFVSREDLTLAALGVRHWEVLGYDCASARRLLTNLLLHSTMASDQRS